MNTTKKTQHPEHKEHAEKTVINENTSAESSAVKSTETVSASIPSQEEKIIGAVGYVSVACFVPLSMKPNSRFCQFHGKQGLVLFGLSIIVLLFLAGIPVIGFFIFLAYFALAVVAAYRAYNGEMWKIPFLGDLAEKIKLGSSAKKNTEPKEEKKEEIKQTETKLEEKK